MAHIGGERGKVALWLGATLSMAGVLVLIGYGLYYLAQDFFGASEIPV